MALVVVLPELVTVWKLGEVPDGQLVPSARQTACPFTVVPAGNCATPVTQRLVEVTDVPDALVKVRR